MLNLRTKKGFIRVVDCQTDKIVFEILTKRIELAQLRTLQTDAGYQLTASKDKCRAVFT